MTGATAVMLDVPPDPTPLVSRKLHGGYREGSGEGRRIGVFALLPSSDVLGHPLLAPLSRAGYSVLAANSRFENYGAALRTEPLLRDVGAGVSFLREHGAERVALLAVSLGGPLMTVYQSQAERPGAVPNTAGETLVVSGSALPPADGLILHAAQRGPAFYITELLDPSVVDERDAFSTDPELDMYDRRNGPPYDREWLRRYRAAQVARNERVTAWAEQMLSLVRQRDPEGDMAFVVHRTAADPRFLDLTIDANERTPEALSALWGDPRRVNNWGNFHARHTTLLSWLSYWSLRRSHIDGHRHIRATTCPVLAITMAADEAVFPPDGQGYLAAAAGPRLTHREIAGATHRVSGQPRQMAEVEAAIDGWLKDTFR